ncbi:hypothetical protein EGT74_06515 [Chitinophaga lutea]|uniref:TerB family tellurite resistance protein n=1 Tax=Chitinophaga lutea TaxID=2488634 RepID=A0A3N4QB12_9BACT|nr:hypothetical protein [Chitinophaga lutea]RPE13180.1 hypothetical protein EGT74_06515 [Chitinophaga lutea]
MKAILLILIYACCTGTLRAQTWNEWFRQGKTQRKYLLDQIVLLQTHLQKVKKGYKTLRDGLAVIGDIKNGDFTIHRIFLDKRLRVSPLVKKHAKAAAIVALYAAMTDRYRRWRTELARHPVANARQVDYYYRLTGQLLDDAALLTADLLMILQDGQLAMTDAERISAIDHLYTQAIRHQANLQQFCDQTLQAARYRGQLDAQRPRLQQTISSTSPPGQ